MGRGLSASFARTFKVLGQRLTDKGYPGPRWTDSLGVYARKRFSPRGEGDIVPEGGSQGDGGTSALFLRHFKKNSRLKNLPMKKIKAIFDRKTKYIRSF